MPNPTVGLTALTLISPTIPGGASTLSIDSSVLNLSIMADANTRFIDVLAGDVLVTLRNPLAVSGGHQFSGSIAVAVSPFAQVFQLTGRNWDPTNMSDPNIGNPLYTPTMQYQLLYLQTQLATVVGPPTGVTVYKGQTTCRIEWATPTYTGFQGVRVRWSPDASGVNTPYQQLGNLNTAVTRSGNVTLVAPSTSTATTALTAPGQSQVVTTETSTVATVSFSSATIPQAIANANPFYFILTTVVQDPVTNAVYESVAAGPFLAGFVNLKVVNPTDFLALQKATDIATRMISTVTRAYPALDLTAHAEIRDVIINTFALEAANMSARAWFERCSSSISAIAQIDDANGDGISDPVASSPFKQQIARAYGLSATDVQTFIDRRFDILGEGPGVQRGGSTASTTALTFFVYTKPTTLIQIPLGVVVATVPDTTTASVQFVSTGSAVIDPSNAASYYDATNNRWAVTVPGQCLTAGSVGNVGAGTVRQVVSGGPSGISVTNQFGAQDGNDQQSNADYAAMIQDAQVTGVDTGSVNGITKNVMQIPGITDCLVVGASATDMLRDWSSIIQKHTFGCVDVYTRGTSNSEQDSAFPFVYTSASTYGAYSTYLSAKIVDSTNLRFQINGFSALNPIYTAVEFVAQSSGRTLWLGVQHAQFDNVNGFITLDPTENAYVINADGTTSVWQIGGVNATNLQVVQSIGTTASATYAFMARNQSGISYTPSLQPVLGVNSIIGPATGAIYPASIELFYTNDFLLTGGSNDAGDTVVVDGGLNAPATATVTLATGPVPIDSNMNVPTDANGKPQNILSVRSTNLSTLYTFGVDYTITAAGPYRQYAITPLAGGALASGTAVLVAYNKFSLNESITLQTDTISLTGTTPSPLLNLGFVYNTWLPASYGNTTLLLDGYNGPSVAATGLMGAGVAPASRYIKVAFNNGSEIIAIEGRDFELVVNSATGTTTIARVTGGVIPDGQSLTINYFTTEVFTIATEYPTYVQQAIDALDATKHAGADILVKAMVQSPVDVTLFVTLASNASTTTVDPILRTVLGQGITNANTNLAQSQLLSIAQQVTGVTEVGVPLVKCAKSDASYDIGFVVPTGTVWDPLATDVAFETLTLPANSFITAAPVLQNSTIPSGGPVNAYVGMLYEGQAFTRCLSIAAFLASSGPSFYIIGANDQISPALTLNSTYAGRILISVPAGVANPGLQAYRVTYQVFGEGGAKDISVASTEYLTVGSINILYSSGS